LTFGTTTATAQAGTGFRLSMNDDDDGDGGRFAKRTVKLPGVCMSGA